MSFLQPRAIPRGIAIACLFAATLMPLIILPWHTFPFITGKALYLRLLLIGAALAWLLACLAGDKLCPPRRILMSLLVLLGAQALADALAAVPARAFLGTAERQEGFLGLFYFALHVVLLTSVIRGKLAHAYAVALVLVSCLVALSSLYTAWVWWPHKYAGGTLGNPSYVGIYCVMSAFLALWLGLRSPWWMLAAGLSLGAAILTQSRGAGVAIAMGLTAALLPLWPRKWRLVAIGAGSALLSVTLLMNLENERIVIWELALKVWALHPWLGFGQEHFEFISQAANVHLPAQTRAYDRAHNWVLDRLIDGGLVTLLAWLWLVFEIARLISLRKRHQQSSLYGCLAAYLTGGLFLFDVQATLATLAGLVAIAASESRDVHHEPVVIANRQPALHRGARTGRAD